MDETPSQLIQDALASNPLLWGRFYCPRYHTLATPYFHTKIMEAAMKHRFLVIAAPREFAKSNLINFDYVFHALLYKRHDFIIVLSNPYKKAVRYLEAIKKELTENEKIKRDYPPIKILKDAEGDSVFKHQDGTEINITCKGVEQIGTIRGIRFKYNRPTLIVCDDIEDDEMVKNPERRLDLQTQFDEALIPAGERGRCQYIFIGTMLHDDSLLAKLLSKDKYPEYHKMLFRARNVDSLGQRYSLWPEKMSVEELDKLEREKPTVFAKEYQNDPVSGSNVRFDKKDFRYWRLEGSNRYILFGVENEVLSTGLLSDCKAAIACDLAWKEKRSSDSTVIMPAFLTPTNDILIENYVTKIGMRPDEFIEQVFVMVERLEKLTGGSVPVGFEKAMLETVTQWMMKRTMRERNRYILTKELVWDADKETRIETRLQPRYAQHVIYHKTGMGDLEQQLVRFPSAAHDDLVDAAQGLCQLLQFPKGKSKVTKPDDEFMRVRQIAIDAKKPKPFAGFGAKGRVPIGIPVRPTWISSPVRRVGR